MFYLNGISQKKLIKYNIECENKELINLFRCCKFDILEIRQIYLKFNNNHNNYSFHKKNNIII